MILDLSMGGILGRVISLLGGLVALVVSAAIGGLAALGGWHVYHDFISGGSR